MWVVPYSPPRVAGHFTAEVGVGMSAVDEEDGGKSRFYIGPASNSAIGGRQAPDNDCYTFAVEFCLLNVLNELSN